MGVPTVAPTTCNLSGRDMSHDVALEALPCPVLMELLLGAFDPIEQIGQGVINTVPRSERNQEGRIALLTRPSEHLVELAPAGLRYTCSAHRAVPNATASLQSLEAGPRGGLIAFPIGGKANLYAVLDRGNAVFAETNALFPVEQHRGMALMPQAVHAR